MNGFFLNKILPFSQKSGSQRSESKLIFSRISDAGCSENLNKNYEKVFVLYDSIKLEDLSIGTWDSGIKIS